ncbi:uncharacterized protein LOC131640380 [Vicia villosa]|uniref:uncharacterized protein LOC131640380 n=1 Tax=Vicia villosa TaxID=3911 RepID=UPI00273C8062|nr:uncharacterized protein LOC131640380 [Vicia villosa]
MEAKRGLRHGDPISPILFVIVMKYLHRKMQMLGKIPNYNYHSMCEKASIIDVSFADDLLVFTRGDMKSVELAMNMFAEFSKATSLKVNPNKCQVYFGGLDDSMKEEIRRVTGFKEGKLPFQYLGISLTSKRMNTHHYMCLIENIVSRIKHWSVNFLSYAGRLQLIRSVLFAKTKYWLSCLPLPKSIMKKLNCYLCTFLWTSQGDMKRKSPVAWKTVCAPKNRGGLNMISIEKWNQAQLIKQLWNLSQKSDNLWVKWVHTYYIKKDIAMTVGIKTGCSWILKAILSPRQIVQNMNCWHIVQQKIKVREIYNEMVELQPKFTWRTLFMNNLARLRACFVVWMACHVKLATKERLCRMGLINNDECVFCSQKETLNHLLFTCLGIKPIWNQVLSWIQIRHDPGEWKDGLKWVIQTSKGKGWKTHVLKIAFIETTYACWKYRNERCFNSTEHNRNIVQDIIDVIVYRCWGYPKIKKHISHLIV